MLGLGENVLIYWRRHKNMDKEDINLMKERNHVYFNKDGRTIEQFEEAFMFSFSVVWNHLWTWMVRFLEICGYVRIWKKGQHPLNQRFSLMNRIPLSKATRNLKDQDFTWHFRKDSFLQPSILSLESICAPSFTEFYVNDYPEKKVSIGPSVLYWSTGPSD